MDKKSYVETVTYNKRIVNLKDNFKSPPNGGFFNIKIGLLERNPGYQTTSRM